MAATGRYGILADVHANIQALDVALNYLDQVGVDRILQLGDLVGYGGSPREVIERLMARKDVVHIQGNHDRQLCGDKDPTMRKTAAQVLEWSREQLTGGQIAFLEALPESQIVDRQFLLVHGAIADRDAYILSAVEVKRNLERMITDFPGVKICYFAHTHIPMLIGTKHILTDLKKTVTYQLDRDDIYLINPGSVGQPRDKCPMTSFGVFDAKQWAMTFIRQPYDREGADGAITDAGRPEKSGPRGGESGGTSGPVLRGGPGGRGRGGGGGTMGARG